MSNMNKLPAGFEDLEPLAERWARPTENARNAIRYAASAADFADFHAHMMPRLDALLALLQQYPPSPEDDAENLALQLVCAFAEAAPHHDLYGGSPQVPYSFDARRFVPDHGDVRL
jgi:hypothetical protein